MKKLLLPIVLLFFITLSTTPLLASADGYCDFLLRTWSDNEAPLDCRLVGEAKCKENSHYCSWRSTASQTNIFLTGKKSPTDDSQGTDVYLKNQPVKGNIFFIPQIRIPNIITGFEFKEQSTEPIASLVKNLLNYAVRIVGLISLIVVIFGGFLWSTSAGSGARVNEAKQWLFSGLSGLFLILFSYTLLNTINPNLVNLRTTQIKMIEGKEVALKNKSTKDQVEDDCSQFNGYYSSTGNHGVEGKPYHSGCCLVYIKNAAPDPDKSDRPSILRGKSTYYAPNKILDARDSCLEYAKNLNNMYYNRAMNTSLAGTTVFGKESWSSTKSEVTLQNIFAARRWHEGIKKSLDALKPRNHISTENTGNLGLMKTSSVKSMEQFATRGQEVDYSSIFISTQSNYTARNLINWSYDSKNKIKNKMARLPSVTFQNYNNTLFPEISKVNDFRAVVIFIEDGACWEQGDYIKQTLEGKDSDKYCQNKEQYEDCMIKKDDGSKRLWGYCDNGECHECSGYGEMSDHKYKCPDPDGPFSTESQCVDNYRCGKDANGVLKAGMCKQNTK